MAYTHFGKPAEVFKHLALCSILERELPDTYIESNSAYANYLLSNTPEQIYGIYTFLEKAVHDRILFSSSYFALENEAVKTLHYTGSPGLAMTVLEEATSKFLFFDIDPEALKNITSFAEKRKIQSKIQTFNQDSRNGIRNLLDDCTASTFIHIDPYDAIEPDSQGYSYLDLFCEAASRGIKCFLWYGFNSLQEKDILNKQFELKNLKNMSCTELIMDTIRQSNSTENPGIMGSGLLTSNLSDYSNMAIERHTKALVELYRHTIYKNGKGDMYYEKVL